MPDGQNDTEKIKQTETERAEYLKIEIDHYFRSEIQSEQRASWLLTITGAVEALVLNALVGIAEGKLHASSQLAFTASSIILIFAAALALLALWPLKGRHGRLWGPLHRPRPLDTPHRPTPSMEEHYQAHRIRAEKKSIRVVWALLGLGVGIAFAVIGILRNTGWL